MNVEEGEAKIEELWGDDLLNRKADAGFLIGFLRNRIAERMAQGRGGSYVLNLDAAWGEGKTFFLTRLKRELESSGFLAVSVNAWRDDHADDPMLAVMSAIDEAIAPFLKRKKALQKAWEVTKNSGVEIAVAATKHGLATLGKKLIGEGVAEIAAIASRTPPENRDEVDVVAGSLTAGIEALLDRSAETALNSFRQQRSSFETFRSRLAGLLSDLESNEVGKLPIFILIDELDRCRPTYALQLLERVKHLFDVANVAFVLATDSDQLRHSVKAVYGNTFDSGAYLRRFFDRTYHFPPPPIDAFVGAELRRIGLSFSNFELPPQNDVGTFLVHGVLFFKLSLRDVQQCFDVLHTVATVWAYPVPIQIGYLFPLIVAHQQNKRGIWNALVQCNAGILEDELRGYETTWTLSFMQSMGGQRARQKEVDIRGYLSELFGLLSKPLPEIGEKRYESEPANTIQDVFLREFHTFHQGRYYANAPPSSVLRTYPELVRNAGRLRIPTASSD